MTQFIIKLKAFQQAVNKLGKAIEKLPKDKLESAASTLEESLKQSDPKTR